MHKFGGRWTDEKLALLDKYMTAFCTALQAKYHLMYIDGFAGTGDRELASSSLPLIDELNDEEIAWFAKGSARVALEQCPGFDRFIFIESNPKHFERLSLLIDDYPASAGRVSFHQADINQVIGELCDSIDWVRSRAIVFVDPYGCQLEWSTLETLASSKACDVWILFPTAAVSRMMPRNGNFQSGWKERLNRVFGTDEWYDKLYKAGDYASDLFGDVAESNRAASEGQIEAYYEERLRTIFQGGTAGKPRRLYNYKKRHLYSFFFACANPNKSAVKLSMRIANHIIER